MHPPARHHLLSNLLSFIIGAASLFAVCGSMSPIMKRSTRRRKRNSTSSPSTLLRGGMLGAISGGVLFLVWGYVHGNPTLPTYFDALATVLKFIVPLLFLVGLASLCLQRK